MQGFCIPQSQSCFEELDAWKKNPKNIFFYISALPKKKKRKKRKKNGIEETWKRSYRVTSDVTMRDVVLTRTDFTLGQVKHDAIEKKEKPCLV